MRGGEGLVKTLDANAPEARESSLRLDSDGHPVVAYYNSSSIRIVICDTTDCSSMGTSKNLISVSEEPYVSLQLNSNDKPVFSYFDGMLQLLSCTDTQCSSVPIPETVDSSTGVGKYSSLQFDSSTNYPIISYYTGTNLKIAFCKDSDCSGLPDYVNPDGISGNKGEWTSMQVRANFRPYISYYHRGSRALRVAPCINSDCKTTSDWLPKASGSGGSTMVGKYSSIVLNGANPYQYVSYYDETNNKLLYTYCSSSSCINLITPVELDTSVVLTGRVSMKRNGVQIVTAYAANGVVKVATCPNLQCSSGIQHYNVSDLNAGYADGSVSMQLNGDLNPVISYYDSVGEALKIAIVPINPTPSPTSAPTSGTGSPTKSPTPSPTQNPTKMPSPNPTHFPSIAPSLAPSIAPSLAPTLPPSRSPSFSPSLTPSFSPTHTPTYSTSPPSLTPSIAPTLSPSNAPIYSPTDYPTTSPICEFPRTMLYNTGYPAQYASLQVRRDNDIIVAYYNVDTFDLRIVFCPDSLCLYRVESVVDNNGSVGFFNSLQLDSNGYAVMSYYDASYARLKLAHCQDLMCTLVNFTVLDDSVSLFSWTSLRFDSQNRPVVSYYDHSSNQLKLAVCDDPECTSVSVNFVQNTVGGEHAALQLTIDNHPVISYIGIAGQDPAQLAICHNVYCTNTTIVNIDTDTQHVLYTSVQVDGNGYPLMSYYDLSEQVLKLVVCHDKGCVATTKTTVYEQPTDAEGKAHVLEISPLTGYPAIVYSSYEQQEVILILCENPTCTARQTFIIDEEDYPLEHLSFQFDTQGHPAISYVLDGGNNTYNSLKIARCYDERCFNPTNNPLLKMFTEIYRRYRIFDFVVNPITKYPVINYYNSSYGIYLITCRDLFCDTFSREWVDDIIMYGYTSLQLNKDQHPVMSYHDVVSDDFKIATCYDEPCIHPFPSFEVIEGGTTNFGYYSSVKFTNDDFRIIAYYDTYPSNFTRYGDASSLNLMVCQDDPCTARVFTTLDIFPGNATVSALYLGKYTSMEIGHEGFPVITYLDASNHYLKLAVCYDLYCNDRDIVVLYEYVNHQTSLQLNEAGYPVIFFMSIEIKLSISLPVIIEIVQI